MSLINLPWFELPDVDDVAAHGAPAPRADGGTTYVLVHNDPADPVPGYWVGWALIACDDTGWSWGTSLAARGAGALASARVAQAVSVRVLAEQGVVVEGWTDTRPDRPEAQPEGVAGFRARLLPP